MYTDVRHTSYVSDIYIVLHLADQAKPHLKYFQLVALMC